MDIMELNNLYAKAEKTYIHTKNRGIRFVLENSVRIRGLGETGTLVSMIVAEHCETQHERRIFCQTYANVVFNTN